MSKSPSVKSLERLTQVLDCFTFDRPGWSLTELSEHLNWPKGTTHRFLTALETHGILRRNRRDKTFKLGYKLYVWGNLAAESMALRHVAHSVMQDLVTHTGETALLTIYHDQEVVCIDKIETQQPVRMTLQVGHRGLPHAGASRKVLMAYLPQAEIEAIIRDKGLPRLSTNTITGRDELLEELARIRELGFAHSCEETDLGARGIAVPIFDPTGQVVGSVGIAGPHSRFTEALAPAYTANVREAAQQISHLLGAGALADANRRDGW
jgi:DNA-binding IclR family transcriptional regulator